MTRDTTQPARDFDFLAGRWTVNNRRLRQRHAGSQDWDEFPAVSQGWKLVDGLVSVDEIVFPTRGFTGCTVRSFDVAAQRWSIYWINSHTGTMFPPVHGRFAGDRGEFHGEDVDDGRPVQVRYLWTKQGPDTARWEQAFSLDGKTWETNWIMEFTRAA